MEVAVAGPPLAGDVVEAVGPARQVLGDRPVQCQIRVRRPGPCLEQVGERAIERTAGALDPSERMAEALLGVPCTAQTLLPAERRGRRAAGRAPGAAQLQRSHRRRVDRPPERIVGRVGRREHHRAEAGRVADGVRLPQERPVRVSVEGDRPEAECGADGLDVRRGLSRGEPLIPSPELVGAGADRDQLRDHPALQLRAVDRLRVSGAALVDQHQVATTQQRPKDRPVGLRGIEVGARVARPSLDRDNGPDRRLRGPVPRADREEDRLVAGARVSPDRRHGDPAAAVAGPGVEVAGTERGRLARHSRLAPDGARRRRSIRTQGQRSQDRCQQNRASQSRHGRSLDLHGHPRRSSQPSWTEAGGRLGPGHLKSPQEDTNGIR